MDGLLKDKGWLKNYLARGRIKLSKEYTIFSSKDQLVPLSKKDLNKVNLKRIGDAFMRCLSFFFIL